MTNIEFNHNDYEILSRQVMYDGIFRIARYEIRHRLFEGGWSDPFFREVLERRSAAAVLPYDPVLDRVILISQFRAGALAQPSGPWLTEIVAGILETHENPAQVAVREAIEEANCQMSNIELISDYFVSAGGSNEYVHIYCGRCSAATTQGICGLKEESENILVHNLPVEEAFARVRNNEIKTAPAIIALQWLELNRQWLREKWS